MAKVNFPFDEWKNLASTDPEAFEKQREDIIRKTISRAPAGYRARLLRLQWRIDMERKRHPNPMSSCVKISKMMLDSVYGQHGLLTALCGQVSPGTLDPLVTAKVLDIRPRLVRR